MRMARQGYESVLLLVPLDDRYAHLIRYVFIMRYPVSNLARAQFRYVVRYLKLSIWVTKR